MKRILMYFIFVVLICPNVLANELIVGSEQNGAALTPCKDNTDCEDFKNATCGANEFCECKETKFCEGRVVRVVTKIGEFCKIDADCNIEHSLCKDNKCTCEKDRVVALDQRRCLKIAAALGGTCEESVQCLEKINHSRCHNEKCVCEQQMHEYDHACYRNVALGEECHVAGECLVTPFTRCIDGRCACKDGYVQSPKSNRCLDIQTKNNGPCFEDIQCYTKLGKSICKMGHCHCAELYQFKFSKSMCVRDMLLGEICNNHSDCHGPEEGESRSECILGICKCRSEYNEEHGYCTSGGLSCVHYPSVLLFFVLVACSCFYDNEIILWCGLAYSIFFMLWITFLGRYFTDNNNYMDDKNSKIE